MAEHINLVCGWKDGGESVSLPLEMTAMSTNMDSSRKQKSGKKNWNPEKGNDRGRMNLNHIGTLFWYS